MAHPNEELVRKGYDAFGKGDMETVSALLADDAVWHFPGKSPFAGDFRGKDEVLGYFGKIAEATGGTFKLEIHDVLSNDEHVVALVEVTAQREGKSLADRAVNVLHVSEGKITEFWAHPGDQYAVDEFWS